MKLKEILVIDDSDVDLLYTSVILESAQIAEKIRTFETGIDTLKFLQQPEGHSADLILLDINMPEMSGFEFLAAYEKLPIHKQVSAVVVMLTSSPDPTDRARALSYPSVKGYILKPLDIATAKRLITVGQHRNDAADPSLVC